ncbi:MAG: phage major tail protein, TP901-1 family [Proteobacteria bacterium]|nr:phage major tail protein, TP901-1 family [Pseudomonadota bacterium]
MAAQKGKLVLLKADTAGGSPQVYTTVAGLRTNTWTVNGEDVDVTTKDNDGWQQRLSGAGVRSISISATGVFQDSVVEETVRQWSFDQTINWYQITFENGDRLECQFQISNYERSGGHDSAETYSLTLISHGTPQYVAA